MRNVFRGRATVILSAVGLFAVACVISTTTRVAPFAKPPAGAGEQVVQSPLKAHMMDGSVVVFLSGAIIGNGVVAGEGMRHVVASRDSTPARRLPLDSVLGMAVFERRVNPLRTLLYSTATTAATAVGAAALAVAIFGSCPTVYADSA